MEVAWVVLWTLAHVFLGYWAGYGLLHWNDLRRARKAAKDTFTEWDHFTNIWGGDK